MRRKLSRLLFDPAIDLAVADSVAAFRARVVLIFVSVPFLFFALSWSAALWAGVTLALEIEAQVRSKRLLAAAPLPRGERVGILLRLCCVTTAWSAGPVFLFLARDGQFRLAGLMWTAGAILYTTAFAFRSVAYSGLVVLLQCGLFFIAPFTLVGHEPPLAIVVISAYLCVYVAFAWHAASANRKRDRDLRRTRRKLVVEAEAARHLAFHDQLTGLVNRRQLTQQLAQAIARADRNGGQTALLLIDLDRFKFVNDTYGHGCGDELLREVARRLTQACRAGDTCARLGGDEFVVLAPSCGAQDAASIAERILKVLSRPLPLAEATLHPAGSIGISLYSGGQGADANLLRQADLALYRVKERGRNGFCFFEMEMDQAVQARRKMELELREAISERAITVVYQPQFDGNIMVGVETLARWAPAGREPISPTVFVALAEECGLIEELGMQVIRQAFADCRRWPQLRTAINLSPVQLRAPSFLAALKNLLAESGVLPERIEFELTESVLLADDVQTQHALASLRDLGFGLALDDFGTGYSSLSYLRRFPINRIKIDRSFVASLPEDKVSAAVVRSVVNLCQTLQLDLIAEGVESKAQQDVLLEAGCRSFQGYLLGQPAPAEDILKLYRQGRAKADLPGPPQPSRMKSA